MSDVPKIRVSLSGNVIYSDSCLPAHVADSCASWPKRSAREAQKILKGSGPIICRDSTAYAAMLSMGMDMLIHGIAGPDLARLVKGWEASDAR